jgi:hypothetical protein
MLDMYLFYVINPIYFNAFIRVHPWFLIWIVWNRMTEDKESKKE